MAQQHVETIYDPLRQAAGLLAQGRKDEAEKALHEAIMADEALDKLLQLTRRLEDYPLALAKCDVRIENRLTVP